MDGHGVSLHLRRSLTTNPEMTGGAKNLRLASGNSLLNAIELLRKRQRPCASTHNGARLVANGLRQLTAGWNPSTSNPIVLIVGANCGTASPDLLLRRDNNAGSLYRQS